MAQSTVIRDHAEANRRRARREYVEGLRDGRKIRPVTIGGKRGKGSYSRRQKHRDLADR